MEAGPPVKPGPFLLDTGFLVALVNAADPAHRACAQVWKGISGPFVTCEGVLVEAAHLLRRAPEGFANAWNIVRATRTMVVSSTRYRIDSAITLMAQYADVPMDFVDASLVVLAGELGVTDVLTLDRRGFATYRFDGRRKFRMWPETSR